MADINDQEKQEYIGKLVNISREEAGYVGVGHAAVAVIDDVENAELTSALKDIADKVD